VDWIELGLETEVKEGLYFIGSDEIWVTSVQGERVIVSNICPHKMGPLSQGTRQGDLARCPWHGYWFDIKCGKYTPSLKLRRYEWKNEEGKVFVRLLTEQ